MNSVNASHKILHVILTINETSMPYNEFCLSQAQKRNISICTYFSNGVEPPSTINTHTGDGSLRGFWRNLHRALDNRPDVIHVHAPHLGILFVLGTLLQFKQLRPCTVFTVHNCYGSYEWRHVLMLLPVFAFFQQIVCCSQASYESFPKLFKWLAGDRLLAIPNGLNIERVDKIVEQYEPHSQPSGPFKVLSISRLVPLKNPTTVVKAFIEATQKPAHLTILGNGLLPDPIIDAVKRKRDDQKITIPGVIPRDEVYRMMATADLYISASRGEGLPLSVLEAMACRCPVILSDIGPHREIAEGVNFIPLINPNDPDGFAREIRRFSQMSAAERQAIGQQCRDLAVRRFNLTKMHAAYAEVYEHIVCSPQAQVKAA